MIEEPKLRFWTTASIEFLSTQLGLRNEAGMQDWAWEVADPSDLSNYLAVFAEVSENPDISFTLADVIIQAFEELEQDLETDNRWTLFLDELAKNFEIHAYQIWYWASYDSDLKDAWRVSPYMRSLSSKPS